MFFLETVLSQATASTKHKEDHSDDDDREKKFQIIDTEPIVEDKVGSLSSSMKVMIIFRKPICKTDKLIKYFIGQYTHMEIMIYLDKSPRSSPTFTAFVGENFNSSIMAKTKYVKPDYEAYYLETEQDETECLLDYLIALSEQRIPYNYEDLPLIPFKKVITASGMMDDVNDESPDKIKRLFCSQAFTVAIALRRCLQFKHYPRLIAELKSINSRLTTPCDLFHIIRPYCRQVDPAKLKWGDIKYI